MIRFKCPQCSKEMTAADEHAGKKARCPACREIVVIPGERVAPPVPPAPSPPAPPAPELEHIREVEAVEEDEVPEVPVVQEEVPEVPVVEELEEEKPRPRRRRPRYEEEDYDYGVGYSWPAERRHCQGCGAPAPTQYVEFYQNIGVLILRFHKSLRGNLCRECLHKYFWEYTLITACAGWWGIISFFLTPIFLLNNTIRYIACLCGTPE